MIIVIQAVRWYLDLRDKSARKEVRTGMSSQYAHDELEKRVASLENDTIMLDKSVHDLRSRKLPDLLKEERAHMEKTVDREVRHVRELLQRGGV